MEPSGWDTFVKVLYDINPLINLVVAILWSIYVYYTIKTFREIHSQNKLQNEPFLVVAGNTCTKIEEGHDIPNGFKELNKKWRKIIESNLPDAIQQDKYLVLRLHNKGRSDIIKWEIYCKAIIGAGKRLSKINISGETFEWIMKSENFEHIISPGDFIDMPIGIVGIFPSIEFEWQIKYADIRNTEFKAFAGDREIKAINAFADPKGETPKAYLSNVIG
jgi:hypothetical protein